MEYLDSVSSTGKVVRASLPLSMLTDVQVTWNARSSRWLVIGAWLLRRGMRSEVRAPVPGLLITTDILLGGKFQTKAQIEERKKNNEGLRKMLDSGEQTEEQVKISAALEKVANEHSLESPTAVALAYVMAKTPNVCGKSRWSPTCTDLSRTGLPDHRWPQGGTLAAEYQVA